MQMLQTKKKYYIDTCQKTKPQIKSDLNVAIKI